MLTKLFAAPVKAKPQYAEWLHAIALSRFAPQNSPIPTQWIHNGFYTELDFKSPENILSHITTYFINDFAKKETATTVGKLLDILSRDYADYPELQLYCVEKLAHLKKIPPLTKTIITLVKTIAKGNLSKDYTSTINDLALLIEKIQKTAVTDINTSLEAFAHVLTLAAEGKKEKAEVLGQKAYQKLKQELPTSADRQLVILTATLAAAEYRIKLNQPQKAYAILLQILGPSNNTPDPDIESNAPLHSTLKMLLSLNNEKLIAELLLKSIIILQQTMERLGKQATPNQHEYSGYAMIAMLNEIAPYLLPKEHFLDDKHIDGSLGWMYPETFHDLYTGPLPTVDESLRKTIISLCEYIHEVVTIKLENIPKMSQIWRINAGINKLVYSADMPDLEQRGFIIYNPDRTWFTLRKDLRNEQAYDQLVDQGLLTTAEANYFKDLLPAIRFRYTYEYAQRTAY